MTGWTIELVGGPRDGATYKVDDGIPPEIWHVPEYVATIWTAELALTPSTVTDHYLVYRRTDRVSDQGHVMYDLQKG